MYKLSALLNKLGDNSVGEVLRAITFIGNGYGCYENFEVRPDATPWSAERLEAFIKKVFPYHLDDLDFLKGAASGYTFQEGSLRVDVFWYWDGDGTLYFRVEEDGATFRELINTDCKHDNEWAELEDNLSSEPSAERTPMTVEQLDTVVRATENLTVDELADLVNHLGDGALEEIQDEPWKHHIINLLPAADDTNGIHTLWVILIDIHDRRCRKQGLTQIPTRGIS